MGIVIDQSARNMIITYFGFGIGAINTLFLYTYFLTPEYYGLVSFLLSAANLIWPLMAFGVHNTLVKFYSSYDTRDQKDRFLSMILVLPLGISIILGVIGYLGYGFLLDYFSEGNALVQPYIWMIFVISVSTAYFEVFFSWSKVHYRSVFGNFMKEVFHRAAIAMLLLGVFFDLLNVRSFIIWLNFVFLARMLIMLVYAFRLHLPRIRWQFPRNRAFVLKYSSLILISGSVAMVLLDLDKVMIERFLPIEKVAIYGIAVYIASVIAVPSRAMHQITYPMTASLLNKKDMKGLQDLYAKSSLNLLIVSGLVFLLIICNVRQIYELVPEVYQVEFSIVVVLSIIKLYDGLLGNNNSILYNSDHYQLVLYIGVFLAVMAFSLNLMFIPLWGIFGAAMATFLAFAIYNTVKLFIVFLKFRIHPFTGKTLTGLLLIASFSGVFYFWDLDFHPILNMLLKSLLIGGGYLGSVYLLGVSQDINLLLEKYLKFKKME